MDTHGFAFIAGFHDERSCGKRRISTFAAAGALVLLLCSITSCSSSPSPSNQQLEQKAAQAAANAKRDSKQALADARIAAANAEGKVNAIASGVKQGIHDQAGAAAPGPGSRVDLNTASEDDLAGLPGISQAKAAQIIRHRPYASTQQLVTRGLLSRAQFDRISADVAVR